MDGCVKYDLQTFDRITKIYKIQTAIELYSEVSAV